MQIFHFIKYDIKGQWRSQKFIQFHLLNVWFFHSPSRSIFPSLSLTISISLSIFLFCSMQILIYTQINVFHEIKYDHKGRMRPLLCHVILKIFRSFDQITTLTYVLMDNFFPFFSRGGAKKPWTNDFPKGSRSRIDWKTLTLQKKYKWLKMPWELKTFFKKFRISQLKFTWYRL